MKETLNKIFGKLSGKERKAKDPNKLALRAIKDSRGIINDFGIDGALGLVDRNEKILITYYLAQRILRTELYNSSIARSLFNRNTLSSPTEFSKLVNTTNTHERTSLNWLDNLTLEFVQKNFSMNGGVNRAATMEHAINALVIKSKVPDSKGMEDIIVTEDKVKQWGDQWILRVGENAL